MHHSTLRDVLLHRFWLIFSLSGVLFFFFLPNRGILEWFIRLTGILLFIQIFYGAYQISSIPRNFLLLLWAAAILLLLSTLFSGAHTDTHRMYRVIKMLIIVFSIHCLSQGDFDKRLIFLFGAVLASLIILQFVARSVLGMPYGTYSNRHYLANLASLTLPLFFYYYFVTPRPYNFLIVPLAFMDLDLLLRTSSRPAILALSVGTVFTIFFLIRNRRKWIALAVFAGGCILLYVTNYAHVIGRIEDLIINLPTEERVQIWSDTWKMLRHNPPGAWLVGNGIGSFPESFRIYSIPKYSFFPFPHNHLLQILFANGFIGFFLVLAGQILLLFLLMRLASRATDPELRVFINCVTVIYVTWLIFTSLVFGFYSRFTLYPFGFIIGISFFLSEKLPEPHSVRQMDLMGHDFGPSRGINNGFHQVERSGDEHAR
jgi:O-antigen ligase